jgi:protein-glutamine gamma-glutamyltransferase
MITVAGKTVQPGDVGSYPSGSLEAGILSVMARSTEKYSYSSLEELRFKLRLRKETVAASNGLARSGLRFAVFRDSACNPAYWTRTLDGGFRLKHGAEPAKAIRDIFTNGSSYATECATAMMIVFYGALLNVYGDRKFNEVFPRISLMNWRRLDRYLRGVGMIEKHPDYFPGDRRYFMNPDVDPLVPQWQGENVIDLGNRLYYGHGVGIQPAGGIIESLNRNRAEDADQSAYLMDGAGRPDFQSLAALAT